jgi:cholesterol transport system auxiliary component
MIVEAFEDTGKIAAVGRSASDLRADYVLQTELRDFEARYQEDAELPPKVSIEIEAKLVKMPDRQIVGGTKVARQVSAARNETDSVVGAFDEALVACVREIVEWTLRRAR